MWVGNARLGGRSVVAPRKSTGVAGGAKKQEKNSKACRSGPWPRPHKVNKKNSNSGNAR